MMTSSLVLASAPAESAPKFKNCKALNKKYPHGVGMPGAKDKTSGKPVTNFKRSKALYQANKGKDRDKDRIACEKR
ncbi:excalibur calcium-binding domain-containing protein [Aeromicrobium tamlense]|nr:excalibur calcium-binding domain-containing protein [Aeromicrobium tamlense]